MNFVSDQRGHRPTGHSRIRLIGDTLGFATGLTYIDDMVAKYGPVFKAHIYHSSRPTIVVTGYHRVRALLIDSIDSLTWRGAWPTPVEAIFPDGLMTRDLPDARRHRKNLLPHVHGEALRKYVSLIESVAKKYLTPNTAIEADKLFNRITLDIMAKLIFGEGKSDTELRWLSKLFAQLSAGTLSLPINLPPFSFYRAMRVRGKLFEYVVKEIEERLKDDVIRYDILSLMINMYSEDAAQTQTKINVTEIANQILMIFFAGHETTSQLLTSVCLFLDSNPSMRHMLRSEIDNIPYLSFDSVRQMGSIRRFIQESGRKLAIVPGGFRIAREEIVIDGYTIPKNSYIVYSIPSANMDPSVYEQPEKFNPDRFLIPGQPDPLTFGGGQLKCPGAELAMLEATIVIYQLLRNYELVITHPAPESALMPYALGARRNSVKIRLDPRL